MQLGNDVRSDVEESDDSEKESKKSSSKEDKERRHQSSNNKCVSCKISENGVISKSHLKTS